MCGLFERKTYNILKKKGVCTPAIELYRIFDSYSFMIIQ